MRWLLLSLCALIGCQSTPISVRTEFLDSSYLASTHAGTLDLCRAGFCGQQLVIRYKDVAPCSSLRLSVRYQDHAVESFDKELTCRNGFWTFRPQRAVVIGYRVDLIENGQVRNSFSHMWADQIKY